MKKLIILIVIIIIILFSISLLIVKKSNEEDIYLSEVDIEIFNVTKTGADISIRTSTDEVYSLGYDFLIKKEEGSGYKKIKSNCGDVVDTTKTTLTKENSVINNINWYHCYGSLNSGKYRLIKRIIKESDNKEYYIKVDFTIK